MRKLFFEILILSAVAFGVLWLFSPSADAQCANGKCPTQSLNPGWQAVRANPAIVRVRVKDVDSRYSLGSGVVFHQKSKVAYVLTAAHVIADRVDNGVIIWVGKQPYQATVLRSNKLWDIAVLRIADPQVKPIILADRLPEPGDNIECYGLGPNGEYRYVRGSVTHVSPGGAPKTSRAWMEVRATVRQGDSGGPIVNTRGRLVGLITGTGRGVTVGPCLPRIRSVIESIFPVCPPPRPAPAAPASPVEEPEIPSTPVLTDVNYEKLAQAILEQINPNDFRGPAGPSGPAGLAGFRGLKGADGGQGPVGPQGPLGSYSDLTDEEMWDIAGRIKKLINGSVRVKVEAVR